MTGGEDAFRTLYRAHTPALYALALRLTGGDQNEAEDLVQESWARATRKMSAFRGESALPTWLCGVLVNVRRERLRSAWRMVDAFDNEPATPARDDAAFDLESPGDVVDGLFIIRAANDSDAARIAATCPHIRYRGHIEVRRFIE